MVNDVDPTNRTEHARRKSLGEKWGKTSLPNQLLIAFTAVIAIANSIYVGFSLWQLCILQGQLTHIREASHLEQRAWIGISGATHEPIEPNKPVKIKFTFTNTGRTPA